jgi:D-alanyl-D-alanine dipeptidase
LVNVFILLSISPPAISQDTVLNKYGLWVIGSAKLYKKTVETDSGKRMVSIRKSIPDAVIDLKYAGTDNFMHAKLYPVIHTTYLRRNVSDALQAVQQELKELNLCIKIWDAYRPYHITEKMWDAVKDDRYAADPKFGSGHNRGIAVDVTIVNLNTNKELDMGTGFDNFSDTAHSYFKNLNENIIQNRQLLRSVMEKHGFKALETEWWHYYIPEFNKYELLDLPFKDLYKLQ